MDSDLKELLRSVLREELAPINQRLDKIESDVQELKAGQAELQKNIVENLGNFTEKNCSSSRG